MERMASWALLVVLFHPTDAAPQSNGLNQGYVLKAKARYVAGYVVVDSTPCMPEQANGELFVGVKELEFKFRLKKSQRDKHLEKCGSLRPAERDDKGRDKLVIPYDSMCALARGQYPPAPLTDASAILAGLGALGSLFGTVATSGKTRDIWIGSTLGALVAGGSLWALSHRRGNYISIFFRSTRPCGPSQDPFEKDDDVATFQLHSPLNGPHDYWNISIILNARTGKEFVSEAAEKETSGKKSGEKK